MNFIKISLTLGICLSIVACATNVPVTTAPTNAPTPSAMQTIAPTLPATDTPTRQATNAPTLQATDTPTRQATDTPTHQATDTPALAPTQPSTALPTATKISAAATTAPTQPAPTNTRAISANNTFSVGAELFIANLKRPVFVTDAGDGSGRLFIIEQRGDILIVENGRVRETPFLNIRNRVNSQDNERGLLSVAFHPDYKNNGIFFVNYTGEPDGATVIERYHVSADPNVADANSGRVLLQIEQPEPNHNGGMMAFGPDGYLYIGTGDGGGGGDQHGAIGNGQNLKTLLGKMLRIDVNADTYAIPADNPFVNRSDAKPEIWAFGLRNPWRFSFDRATGDLYIGDVGQGSQEEINFQSASARGGENYGWRIMEGVECYDATQNCARPDLIPPIAVYSHDLGCSVSGGYVYRGQKYPWLVGQYLFADYCSGIVWATARAANGEWKTRQVGKFDDTISSFGEDAAGELYVVGHGNGIIYKLTSTE